MFELLFSASYQLQGGLNFLVGLRIQQTHLHSDNRFSSNMHANLLVSDLPEFSTLIFRTFGSSIRLEKTQEDFNKLQLRAFEKISVKEKRTLGN